MNHEHLTFDGCAGLARDTNARTLYELTQQTLMDIWGEFESALFALEFGQLRLELHQPREATRLLEQALPVLQARSLPQVSKAEELLAEATRRHRDRHTPTD